MKADATPCEMPGTDARRVQHVKQYTLLNKVYISRMNDTNCGLYRNVETLDEPHSREMVAGHVQVAVVRQYAMTLRN